MPLRLQSRRAPLWIVLLTVFIDLIGFAMVIPLLPIYGEQFTVDPHGWQLGLLMAIFSIMQLLFAPLWGRLSDRIGRRPVLMMGLAASALFYTLFGVATVLKSIELLFVSRIGAGIAGATISTAQAYIADVTTVEERPQGMALMGVAFGLGFTLGPLFGFLAVPSGYGDPGPWPGYAAAMLSAAAFVLAWFLLPESLHSGSESAVRRKFSKEAIREALLAPSIGMILLTLFVCVASLAAFETTLSMLIKGKPGADSPFQFDWGQTCLTYAYIGLTLALIQGGLVRRLARRLSEGALAATGAATEIVGFGMMVASIRLGSTPLLLFSLAVVVAGFAFLQPSLNSLLSRRTHPARQGGVLGLGQSVNALARITGSLFGIPLLRLEHTLPFLVAAALMALALVLVGVAVRSGKDHALAGGEEAAASASPPVPPL